MLLLDYKLGVTEGWLERLKTYGKNLGFLPTVVLAAGDDGYVAVKSVKLGAAGYINKKDISPKRLAEIITEAADYNPQKESEQQAIMNDATQIIQRIHSENGLIQNSSLDIGYKFVRMIGEGTTSKVYMSE